MAHKPSSFVVDAKKKTITIYTNVEKVEAEQELINFYLVQGFTPKMEEKKPTKTIDDMRKELADAPEVLEEFNKAYAIKTKGKVKFNETGFAKACKIYNKWVKENKAK